MPFRLRLVLIFAYFRINNVSDDPQRDLPEMNRQLHLLGWDAIELDYHTMQLIIACFEAEGWCTQEISHPDSANSG